MVTWAFDVRVSVQLVPIPAKDIARKVQRNSKALLRCFSQFTILFMVISRVIRRILSVQSQFGDSSNPKGCILLPCERAKAALVKAVWPGPILTSLIKGAL